MEGFQSLRCLQKRLDVIDKLIISKLYNQKFLNPKKNSKVLNSYSCYSEKIFNYDYFV